MAEPRKRPSTREGRPSTREGRPRSHSAKARLTPPEPPINMKMEFIAKEAKERSKSAKAIKSKHISSSGMFVPRPPSKSKGPGGKARFTSMYSRDFEGSFVPPAEIRPTSPTRRNNPHPTKQFMVWRVPSREIGAVPYEEGLELPPEYLARDAEFDAIDELSGNLGGMVLPPAQPSSTDYGAYLHKNQAFKRGLQHRPMPRVKPVSQELFSHIMATDPAKQYALEEWLQTATPEEQHTVLKMFKSAEEAQVKETIGKVMQPEAARAVQGWLKGADEKEKEVAVRLFSSLGSRPPMRQRSLSESGYVNRPPSRKNTGMGIPATPRPSFQEGPSGQQGPNLRSRRLSAPPGSRPKPWPAGIWHHKPVRDPPPQVYHRGSLFGAVKGDTSHFNIHPEWPDYYGTA